MIIAIDFDGTCVTHEYPRVGQNIGAWPVIKELHNSGHSIILLTMRSGQYLQDAVNLFEEYSIKLYGINHNPEQHLWTSSPKVYANIYIDDAALGCPLTKCEDRPYANWTKIREMLMESGVLNANNT